MTVYVDGLMKRGWKMRGHPVRNCHMFTDGPIEELHALADQIGMQRKWFQDKRVPHYDLTAARRHAAIQLGAVAVDRHRAVDLWARIQGARCDLVVSEPTPACTNCGAQISVSQFPPVCILCAETLAGFAFHSPAQSAPAPQGNAAAGQPTTKVPETSPCTSGANEGSNPSGRA